MEKTACTIDIESSDLLANMLDYSSFPYKLKEDAKLWCVVVRDVKTGETFEAELEGITAQWMERTLLPYNYIIAHNGIKFDFITLKLFGVFDYRVGYLDEPDTLFGREVKFLDTLILSRLSNPDRFGGHSLKAWGLRTGKDFKDDYRQQCIDAGYIDKNSPKGEEFKKYNPLMLPYCRQDTLVNANVYNTLCKEFTGHDWGQSIKMEHKLADLAVRRESLGFWFDKDAAIACVEDLTQKMEELTKIVNPLLPKKPMNKGELNFYTPPKNKVKKNGEMTASMERFLKNIGAEPSEGGYMFEGVFYDIEYEMPLKTHIEATIDDLDHVKMTLINDYGWIPSEWRERDLTKDSKKQNLSYEKRVAALERWFKETVNGKYKKLRLKELGIPEKKILETLSEKLKEDWPVRVPTSPPIRVGVEKELCPNLIALGEKVSFAKDFALYLTYKHRKSSIAGGDLEDVDLNEDEPNSGFLSMYREVDGRVPTPAIEIGASTGRYRHIGICNIARPSSVYGKEMRSLFGAGPNGIQFGYDFSSLESRVMGHYVMNYQDGPELAEAMIAEKPNDIHSVNSRKLGIPRSEVKSLTYALLYGAQVPKIMKMLSLNKKDATKLYNDYWSTVPALKQLKTKVESFWEENGKSYIPAIDGRKINTRSKHSLLNALFQSAGVLIAKYTNILSMQKLEKLGYIIDPFVSQPSVSEMIAYHDECQLFLTKNIVKYRTFNTKEDAESFVWEGDGQVSSIGDGKMFYIGLPNDVSNSIESAIREVEKLLKLNVPIGYEWAVGNTWMDCH